MGTILGAKYAPRGKSGLGSEGLARRITIAALYVRP
jgi:hypothetical protein